VRGDGEVGRKENTSQREATKEDTKSEPEAVVAPNTGEDKQMVLEAVIETAPTETSVVVEVDQITTTTASSPSRSRWSSSKAKMQSIRGMSFS